LILPFCSHCWYCCCFKGNICKKSYIYLYVGIIIFVYWGPWILHICTIIICLVLTIFKEGAYSTYKPIFLKGGPQFILILLWNNAGWSFDWLHFIANNSFKQCINKNWLHLSYFAIKVLWGI